MSQNLLIEVLEVNHWLRSPNEISITDFSQSLEIRRKFLLTHLSKNLYVKNIC